MKLNKLEAMLKRKGFTDSCGGTENYHKIINHLVTDVIVYEKSHGTPIIIYLNKKEDNECVYRLYQKWD